jgi:hypothetical protein
MQEQNYKYFLQNVETDIGPGVGALVTQGHIDFMTTQLKAYQKKASKRPEFTPYVNEIAKEIELMRRELEASLGITAARTEAQRRP